MDNDHILKEGTVLADEFRIVGVLGSGGFGITYKAVDLSLNRFVAIKEYFPSGSAKRMGNLMVMPNTQTLDHQYQSGLKKFIEEARIIANFKHRNIVEVQRIFSEFNTAYTVLEYIDGPDMEHWLTELGRPPTQEELDRLVFPLLDALVLIHRNHILHRDIKPANILIRAKDGKPVLIDFGAARQTRASGGASTYAIITPHYSPLESYTQDYSGQGAWTDIYGFAATLYRAISGNMPPLAPTRADNDACVSALKLPNTANSYRTPFLQAIDQGLAVKRIDRPQSIKLWRVPLESGAKPVPPLAPPADPAPQPQPQPQPGTPAPGQRAMGAAARAPQMPPAPVPSGAPSLAPGSAPQSAKKTTGSGGIAVVGGALAILVAAVGGYAFMQGDLPFFDQSTGSRESDIAANKALDLQNKQQTEAARKQAAADKRKADAAREAADKRKAEAISEAEEKRKAEADRLDKKNRLAEIARAKENQEREDKLAREKEAKRLAEKAKEDKRLKGLAEKAKEDKRLAELARIEKEQKRLADAERRYALPHCSLNKRKDLRSSGARWGLVVKGSMFLLYLQMANGLLQEAMVVAFPIGKPVNKNRWGNEILHQGEVTALAFDTDGKRFATAGSNGSINMWSLTSPDPLKQIQQKNAGRKIVALGYSAPKKQFLSVAVTQDKESLDRETLVNRWQSSGGKSQGSFSIKEPILFPVFSKQGDRLAAASISMAGETIKTKIKFWNVQSGKSTEIGSTSRVISALAFSPDGRQIIAGGQFDHLLGWKLQGGKSSFKFSFGSFGKMERVRSLAFSPDGKFIAAGSNNGIVRIWNTTSGVRIDRFQRSIGEILALSFVHQQDRPNWLAYSGSDGVVHLRDVAGCIKDTNKCRNDETKITAGKGKG